MKTNRRFQQSTNNPPHAALKLPLWPNCSMWLLIKDNKAVSVDLWRTQQAIRRPSVAYKLPKFKDVCIYE